jgi:hypothetical protein
MHTQKREGGSINFEPLTEWIIKYFAVQA